MRKNRIGSAWTASLLGAVAAACVTQAAWSALKPDQVYFAESRKNNDYLKAGLVVGGDRAVNQVNVNDIRRAFNKKYERIVLDLQGTRDGEPVAIPRPPYYQVLISPEEKRLVISLWGDPRLGFDAAQVVKEFKKSQVVESVELLPRLEEDKWTFVINLKQAQPVEIFELKDPVRLILDIRRG